jgi:hypothetical protein
MDLYRESTYNQMKKAIEFLDSLPIDNADNAIWWCLHQVVWHKGVDRVRWLLENKEFVKQVVQEINMPSKELMKQFWGSVNELKNLDR